MTPSKRNKFLSLMGFHLLWGLVLWFSISKLGLGISTDSVHLLFGASNLAETGMLVSFDGSRMPQWPPLYPALLALIHWMTGLSTFAAAHVLQALAYAGLSICLSLLFLEMFPDDFRLALTGVILANAGAVMVAGFGLVGSDYVHLFLAVLVLLLTARYLENGSPRAFVGIAIAGMLAMLERFIGLAAIATAVVAVLFLSNGNWRERAVRGLVLSLSAAPTAAWLLLTAPQAERRGPLSFDENFSWFSQSLLAWFFPEPAIEAHLARGIVLLWVVLVALAALAVRNWRRQVPLAAKPMLLFGLFYLLALFGSASYAYFNKLGGRFLLPLYIPFITLLLVSARIVLNTARREASAAPRAATASVFAALAIMGLAIFSVSIPMIRASHAGLDGPNENSFNTAQWRTNSVIRYWLEHQPTGPYLLFSNYPDAVAFYARQACLAAPKKYSGPYGTVESPIEDYASQLFVSGGKAYLIWIAWNEQDYYYRPEALEKIADVRLLFRSQDGAVYRLRPPQDVGE